MNAQKEKAGGRAGSGNLSTSSLPPRLLTVNQVAELLNLSRSFVRRLIGERRIPALRIGRAIRVPSEQLAAFVARALGREEGSR